MRRARIRAAVVHAAVCFATAPAAWAQLDDHIWIGGTGNQQWRVNSNWQLDGSPTAFPDDPGRVDPDQTVISDVEGANLSVNLAANLSVDVGMTDITIAALTIGSTSGAVTTNITTSGGRLVFENFESNNTVPEPDVCAFNCGAALITSQGVTGATNTITAVVGVNDAVEVTGSRHITLAGGLAEVNPGGTLSALSPGATVFITGGITTIDSTMSSAEEDVPLALNSSANSLGTIDISGIISGAGRMRYGTQASNPPTLPLGQVILRGNNTYSGRTILSRGNVVLAHDNALGTGDLKQEGPAAGSLQTGFNLISDNDNRLIANDIIHAQWQTVKGEHSIEFSGLTYQTNARGWINMLAAGKTLTLSGQQYTFEIADGLDERILTFDGTGKTVVTGGIRNRWDSDLDQEDLSNVVGSIRKRGSGAMYVDGDNSLPNSDSNFTGSIYVQGGNLHFATVGDVGSAAQVNSEAGAVGVDAGVANILGLLNSSSNPAPDAAGNAVVFDRGGLMLGTTEYGTNLDFSGAHTSAASMSLAAHEGGSTYTGTITTAADNTYRFGGGSGTLTLPNANQLTGGKNVVVTNGGEVAMTNTNNYTGSTSIIAKYVTTLEQAAAKDTINFADDDNVPNDQKYLGTTLRASTLANGGSASSIGSSTNAAANLYIQGSTLKYVGGATSTDRLFTIGTGGATLDASGSGAVNFTNSGTLAVDIAESRTGNLNSFATGNTTNDRITIRNLASTEDLQPGMPVMSPGISDGIPAGTTITRIAGPNDVLISQPIGEFAFHFNTPITFGAAPQRTMTLTGSNTGNNTLAAIIPNASDGGVVGVTKTGAGKWVLTGNNTYTGDTSVENGVLSITNAYLANASDVFMTTGGKLDLNFVGTDVIDELFFNGTAQAAGTWGAIGNVSADFTTAFFTGTGLLQVSTGGVGLRGDHNGDGKVDAADYVLWRKTGVNGQQGYNDWRTNFGALSGGGSGEGGNGAATAGVPEPTGFVLLSIALGAFGWLRRRG